MPKRAEYNQLSSTVVGPIKFGVFWGGQGRKKIELFDWIMNKTQFTDGLNKLLSKYTQKLSMREKQHFFRTWILNNLKSIDFRSFKIVLAWLQFLADFKT